MSRLEDLTKGALVRGVLAECAVKVVDVQWHGSGAITLTYADETSGKVDRELLYRDDEPRLVVELAGRAWSMDADGALFRLVSEAKRISWPTCSTRSWPCRHPTSNLCPIRSMPSTTRCSLASRCAFCWPTIPALARRSWPGSSARS